MTDPAGARSALASAELALVAVSLATAIGLGRLFVDGSFLPQVCAAVVASHALAALCRHRGWGIALSLGVSFAGLALLVGWMLYPETTAFGIPTGETWRVARQDLGDAWTLFQDVKAPAPVEPGFLLGAIVALWTFAFSADWAAFRADAGLEAVIPSATTFVFASVFGAPRWRAVATAMYVGTVLLFLLLQRLRLQQGSANWLTSDAPRGHRAIARAGGVLVVVAVVAGLVLGPAVPGAGDPAVWTPRGLGANGGGSRVTVSPLIDIRKRLVENSSVEVFTVRSSRRSYWRLTSLENFNGRFWSSQGSYDDADGGLPDAVPEDVVRDQIIQEFEIKALEQIWLPAAYEPRRIEGGESTTYDPTSGTLLTQERTSDGQTYRVLSEEPDFDPAQLAQAGDDVPVAVEEEYLALPDGVRRQLTGLARAVTAGAGNHFDEALRLQSWFRDNFTYSDAVPSGQGSDAIQSFLDSREGYCEQFAGTFAAMARALGIPARVAVGFTWGVQDPDDPTLFRVQGRHAHAWPELYFPGHGWVDFEPTPGRGAPDSAHTAVSAAQADQGDGNPTTSTTAPSDPIPGEDQNPNAGDPNATLPDGGTVGTCPPGIQDCFDDQIGVEPRPFVDRATDTARKGGLGLAGIALAWAALVPIGWALVRWRRRRAAVRPRDKVKVAWVEALEGLALAGAVPRAGETDYEYAYRAASATGLPQALLLPLAGHATAAAYAPAELDDDEVAAADEAAEQVLRALRGRASRWQRVRWALDPRPRLPRQRRERIEVAGRRRPVTDT